jgi:hypothetical protein
MTLKYNYHYYINIINSFDKEQNLEHIMQSL